MERYRTIQLEALRFQRSLKSLRNRAAVSLDDIAVSLQANAERSGELAQALEVGAEAVGLYRTEFLYLQGMLPDEETQLARYRSALEALNGKCPDHSNTGSWRGQDQRFSRFLRSKALCQPRPWAARNPFVSARYRLVQNPITRDFAGHCEGPVRCLIPMVTSVLEIRLVNALLEEARNELDARNQPYDADMPLGAMIEVPAAAMAILDLGRHLDFISIGTNDLLQYTLAADRGDEQVAHLYDLQHPGVVRLLRYILKGANKLGIPASVCGEVAGDPRYTRLLLSLGLREFSMHPARLLEVKQIVRETHVRQARTAISTG